MDSTSILLAGNGLLLTILIYLAKEMRSDVREMSVKVAVLWEWFSERQKATNARG